MVKFVQWLCGPRVGLHTMNNSCLLWNEPSCLRWWPVSLPRELSWNKQEWNVRFVNFACPMYDISPHSTVRLVLRIPLIETYEQNFFIGILHWTLSIVWRHYIYIYIYIYGVSNLVRFQRHTQVIHKIYLNGRKIGNTSFPVYVTYNSHCVKNMLIMYQSLSHYCLQP
jgi:hypothetical protein